MWWWVFFTMSIKYVSGDIFEASGYDIAVVPVNCVGVMGAGVALSCKQKHPWVFEQYKAMCDAGQLKPGDVRVLLKPQIHTFADKPTDSRVIIAATKEHWRDPSRIAWVRKCINEVGGLMLACGLLYGFEVNHIGLPLLGAGKGNVHPNLVKQEIMLAHNRINSNRHKSLHKHFHVFTGSGLT